MPTWERCRSCQALFRCDLPLSRHSNRTSSMAFTSNRNRPTSRSSSNISNSSSNSNISSNSISSSNSSSSRPQLPKWILTTAAATLASLPRTWLEPDPSLSPTTNSLGAHLGAVLLPTRCKTPHLPRFGVRPQLAIRPRLGPSAWAISWEPFERSSERRPPPRVCASSARNLKDVSRCSRNSCEALERSRSKVQNRTVPKSRTSTNSWPIPATRRSR
mmetsp:Transcript_95125/g.198895  ORF Transcript_95125/g.198895 Transcript_95125/m.198895 type:complete len:217 (+) Transcript_95125:1617-2267(+)